MIIAMSGNNESVFEESMKQPPMPAIFKGTGKKRIIPTVDFLDGEKLEATAVTGQKPGLIKSGFRIFKEEDNFAHSWRIYLREGLLPAFGLDAETLEKTVEELAKPEKTLRKTIEEISKIVEQNLYST